MNCNNFLIGRTCQNFTNSLNKHNHFTEKYYYLTYFLKHSIESTYTFSKFLKQLHLTKAINDPNK